MKEYYWIIINSFPLDWIIGEYTNDNWILTKTNTPLNKTDIIKIGNKIQNIQDIDFFIQKL